MARLRHLAICSRRPEDLAAFYCDTFGMTELSRHTSAESGKTAVFLSDGDINLALIPAPAPEGLHHFGFEVESVDAAAGAALAHGALQGPNVVPQDGRQNEAFIRDPMGQRVDLSTAGWIVGGGGRSRIQHLALKTDDPAALAGFYVNVFGMHRIAADERAAGGVALSDGYVNLALVPYGAGEREAKDDTGVGHLGIRIDDLPAVLEKAVARGATTAAAAASDPARSGEVFVYDPAGQRVDLSEHDWECGA